METKIKIELIGGRIERQGLLIARSAYVRGDKLNPYTFKDMFKYIDSMILYAEQAIRELKDLALSEGYPMHGLATEGATMSFSGTELIDVLQEVLHGEHHLTKCECQRCDTMLIRIEQAIAKAKE